MDARQLEILLIDDEDIVGKRLRPMLEKAGYQVEVFTSGREAIERLARKTFDIVISDVRIDEVDGLEVLAAVQQHSSRTKTIMITGFATLELAREALAKGAFEFIAKPFYPKDLKKVVDKAAAQLRQE
ncbi:MAG: response regulator [Deltaproteobacteria bacterium]|nr:MAG: response regulator [Deltaproteobacteria bacterium]